MNEVLESAERGVRTDSKNLVDVISYIGIKLLIRE